MSRPGRPGPAAYLAPTIVFGSFTAVEASLPPVWYPVLYAVKVCAVTASLYFCRATLRDITPSWRWLIASAFLGIAVCVLWIGLEEMLAYPHLGTRTSFDPAQASATIGVLPFLGLRLYGLVVMVPVMEEVFWRSFLLRYATGAHFEELPIGAFSTGALLLTVAASAASHTEWLAAALANLAYCLWIRRTRSLFSVVIAHATTNAVLGAYILATHAWRYW